ncbi:MAG: hypothetical protein PHD67_11220 [Oscillospiraceae bacterium]|nr:hypothetical protein [Oscillospiraceae bacterium]
MPTLAEEWTAKLAVWRSSGKSITAWCRENGEGYHRFRYWRHRLEKSESAKPGRFIEVRLGASPLILECNGVTIQLSSGFDATLLTDVLAVLKRM